MLSALIINSYSYQEVNCNQTWSRLRNRHRKPIRIDSRSFRFRFVPIRFEISKSRIVIDYFNFDFGIYICMFSEKSVLFRYYRNVTDSYRKKVMTIKITVLLPIFVPPSLFNRIDTDVYNKQISNQYISRSDTDLQKKQILNRYQYRFQFHFSF